MVRAQEILPLSPISFNCSSNLPNITMSFFSMRTSTLTLFRSLTLSLSHSNNHLRRFSLSPPFPILSRLNSSSVSAAASAVSIENPELPDSLSDGIFNFDRASAAAASVDLKHLSSVEVEVKDLSEMPEQWRRARLAWLCKELPAHKAGTLVRILNAQKKWMRQEDATYVVVHCMRIRENETAFRGGPLCMIGRTCWTSLRSGTWQSG